MITASAVLVALAFVTLVIGIVAGSGLGLIWVSIASSIGAAVSLGLGVRGGGKSRVAPVSTNVPPAASAYEAEPLETDDEEQESAAASTLQRALAIPVTREQDADDDDSGDDHAVPLGVAPGSAYEDQDEDDEDEEAGVEPAKPVARASRSTRKPAAKKTAAKRPAAKKPAAKKPAAKKAAAAAKPAAAAKATTGKVVVIPDRDKFHTASCRYAKGEGAMTLTKAQAARRGFEPCGVCKP